MKTESVVRYTQNNTQTLFIPMTPTQNIFCPTYTEQAKLHTRCAQKCIKSPNQISLLLSDSNHNWNISSKFSKFPKSNFINICPVITNPCSTNKRTVLLLCISLLISSYMFQLNCHHQGTNTYIKFLYTDRNTWQW